MHAQRPAAPPLESQFSRSPCPEMRAVMCFISALSFWDGPHTSSLGLYHIVGRLGPPELLLQMDGCGCGCGCHGLCQDCSILRVAQWMCHTSDRLDPIDPAAARQYESGEGGGGGSGNGAPVTEPLSVGPGTPSKPSGPLLQRAVLSSPTPKRGGVPTRLPRPIRCPCPRPDSPCPIPCAFAQHRAPYATRHVHGAERVPRRP